VLVYPLDKASFKNIRFLPILWKANPSFMSLLELLAHFKNSFVTVMMALTALPVQSYYRE
jgi:hypothetical protein